MIELSLAEIAELTGGEPRPAGGGAIRVTGPVVIDSRKAAPGTLFAAIVGERADGHDFAAAAAERGAVAVLGTRPVDGAPTIVVPDVLAALAQLARNAVNRLSAPRGAGRPGLVVAGITGSSGKTSTKDLTAQLVERLGETVSPEGSLNNEIGVPLTVLRADERTRTSCWRWPRAAPATSRPSARSPRPDRRGAERGTGTRRRVRVAGDRGEGQGELVEALPACPGSRS